MSIDAAIRSLEEVNPDAVRLAERVSFAVMIDRAFLRATRLALSPPVDAGAEADLWFSALVQSRTADGIVFHPEAADALRQRLKRQLDGEQLKELWKRTSTAHAWLAPSLQLEERIAYLSVSKEATADEDLAACLRSVLAAMVSGERAGLAQWAVRALAMFPSRVQALPEARMLDTGTRMRLGGAIDAQTSESPLPSWMPWLAPASLGTVSLQFELRDGELQIRTTTQDLPVRIPKTNPLILEVSWRDDSRRQHTRQITFRDQTTVPVGSRELTLRTITGEEFDLHETGRGTSRLREAIVDFSREMARHREVVGREEELAEVFRLSERYQLIAITGEPGLGKTAFLCKLIRDAEKRGIPTFAHFFRFGDLRLESIAAAERSLSAQIAVRFRMDERVLDLGLIELLRRVPSPRALVVVDDIDKTYNADRQPFSGDAFWGMFDGMPSNIIAIGTSTWARITAEYVHALRPSARNPINADEVRRVLDISGARANVTLAAVALQPLPAAILDQTWGIPDALIRIEGDEFLIRDDVTRSLAIDALGPAAVEEGHRALVNALTQARHLERVDLYYLTNAVWHLGKAGDADTAAKLALSLDFMTAKIQKFGVRPLIADLRMLARTPLTSAIASALADYASEIEESPPELAPILCTRLLTSNLPASTIELPDLPLAPELITNVDTSSRAPQRHDGPIRGSRLLMDPEGNIALATWSNDGTAKLWSRDNRTLIATLEAAAPVTAFAVKPPYAVTADANGFLHLFNLHAPSNRIVRVNAHDRAIDGMLLDSGSGLIVTWAGTDPIRLWSVPPDQETIVSAGELRGHSSAVVGCALMAEGQLLISASRGGMCRLWSIGAREELGGTSVGGATGVAFHWDASSRFILTGKRTLDVVQVAQSSLTVGSRSIDTGHDLPVTGVAISPDGRFTATWSDDQTIRLWKVPMMSGAQNILRVHRAAITACRFHPQPPWLISADADGVAIVWDRESGGIVSRFDRHVRAIRTIEIDGNSILTGDDDGIVMQWNVESGALTHDFSKPEGRIDACVVLPGDDLPMLISDGETGIRTETFERMMPMTRPILATSRKDVFACAADASFNTYFMAGQMRLIPLPDVPDIAACAVTDDSYFAIATRDGRVFAAGPDFYWQELADDSPTTHLAFATNRTLVTTSIDRTLSIWDLERGEQLHRIEAHRSRILALAAFENTAVTGSADGTLRIWDLRTGSAKMIEAAHDGPITGLWMEGNIVVSASLDRTVRVFDYKLGKELAVCRGHRDRVTGVAIAMTDEVIYSCSDDRTIRQWDIDTGEQKAVVYGTAPFRCISWRDGKLAAGDDAGNLWTVKEQTRAEPRTRVYISHSQADNELAERLSSSLLQAGIETNSRRRFDDVFADSAQIAMSSTVVVIATAGAIKSIAVRQEVEEAIHKRKRIIALTAEMNRFDMMSGWPQLRSFTTVKVMDWRFLQSSIRQLIDAIRSVDDRPA